MSPEAAAEAALSLTWTSGRRCGCVREGPPWVCCLRVMDGTFSEGSGPAAAGVQAPRVTCSGTQCTGVAQGLRSPRSGQDSGRGQHPLRSSGTLSPPALSVLCQMELLSRRCISSASCPANKPVQGLTGACSPRPGAHLSGVPPRSLKEPRGWRAGGSRPAGVPRNGGLRPTRQAGGALSVGAGCVAGLPGAMGTMQNSP